MQLHENGIRELLKLPPAAQIGMVVPDLDLTVAFLEKNLALGPFLRVASIKELMGSPKIYCRGELADCDLSVAFTSMGSIELEIIQPVSGPTIHQEFIDSGRQGLHHLAFDVPDDLEQRIETYQKMGIEVIMNGEAERSKFAYLDTESLGGFIIELIRRPPKKL